MRLTKFTHACVRLEKDGKVLVIDPGVWSEDDALTGADAVLVTHEHPDHLNADRLRATGLPVWTNAAVAAQLGETATVVEAGQSFSAAGFTIRAYGNDHAIILPELGVPCQNTAYLVEDAVYHPGDSWTRPDRPVHTNLVPLSAPWYAMADAIGYVREVESEQLVNIHDALLSDRGLELIGRNWIGDEPGRPYTRLLPGESINLP
jgi:L-ascorbate metabolism protein UlaG (beta-lactamase superfamily)